ncbi:LacI family transcriptional regulator [Rahnella sp. BIGb0236]|uniref:LacI family DNA-binding transcriptional regulator n=1 Tax=Rahnella sp. BIGb0236 TaxID=2485117 RepID=UPI001061F7F5|nr:LacI family DNA-binding transcriptional regulator [Rahnella sp. BIGb0236]TDS98182.1 LacI family transcriptional regulator [Rahnella sp. BIGb0236]
MSFRTTEYGAVKKTKRITISGIAELAGVSKSTASQVLNGHSKKFRISDLTRDRVLAVAAEHHYQPSIHARSLNVTRSFTLGLVVPEMTNYGFAVCSNELETLCRENGMQLLIACTDENTSQETMVVNNLIQRQVDGLIVASSMLNDAEYVKISQQLPVVLFDRHMQDTQLPIVVCEAIESSAELVSRIAQTRRDEFYFLGGQPRISPTRDRLAGYQLGLQRAGITLNPDWVMYGNYHPSSGYEMFAQLCARLGRPPKALFVASCGLMEGVLRYMSQHQLLESDIHLCSFDDHYLYDSLSVKIDTVAQDCGELAMHCFSMISDLMNDQPIAQTQCFLTPKLHWRSRHVSQNK